MRRMSFLLSTVTDPSVLMSPGRNATMLHAVHACARRQSGRVLGLMVRAALMAGDDAGQRTAHAAHFVFIHTSAQPNSHSTHRQAHTQAQL